MMTEESFVLIQNPSKQSDLIIYGRIGLPPVFVLQTVQGSPEVLPNTSRA
jgi:hypothetical protein